MSDSGRRLVEALDRHLQRGGVSNIMQPGRIVSVEPPVVEVCGVRIKKRVHVNPAMRTEADLQKVTDCFDTLLEKFQELEQYKEDIPEPKDLVDKMLELLAGPMQDMFQAVKAYHEKGLVHAGDQIMLRQDGNDMHVMTGTGG